MVFSFMKLSKESHQATSVSLFLRKNANFSMNVNIHGIVNVHGSEERLLLIKLG